MGDMADRNARRIAALVALVSLVGAGLAGCLGPSSYSLPDRSDPSVRATEAELAERFGRNGSRCQVRLLGEDGDVRYAWLDCTSEPEPITLRLDDGETQTMASGSGASVPVRIEGDRSEGPGDGTAYEPDVRRLFPAGLADRILNDPYSLRP
jgi:hypothetical protein